MRRVIKRPEPHFFLDWKALGSEEWIAKYSNLLNPTKRDLHLALIAEQAGTCCYCGVQIDLNNSHIEHFRPQQAYPNLTVAYENLFASCIRETAPGAPLHCGHLKDDWFDEGFYISPLDETCEQLFSYALDGQILPLSPVAAEMITVLGLDVSLPKDGRRRALLGVFNSEFIASATAEELESLRLAFQQDSEREALPSYFHVVARYAEQLI